MILTFHIQQINKIMSKILNFGSDVRDYSDVNIIFKLICTIHRNANAEGYNVQLLVKIFSSFQL